MAPALELLGHRAGVCRQEGTMGFKVVWWLQVDAIRLEKKEIIKAFNILYYRFLL